MFIFVSIVFFVLYYLICFNISLGYIMNHIFRLGIGKKAICKIDYKNNKDYTLHNAFVTLGSLEEDKNNNKFSYEKIKIWNKNIITLKPYIHIIYKYAIIYSLFGFITVPLYIYDWVVDQIIIMIKKIS
jgi:hypothetical protein